MKKFTFLGIVLFVNLACQPSIPKSAPLAPKNSMAIIHTPTASASASYLQKLRKNESIETNYINPKTRAKTVQFFAKLTKSLPIAEAILYHSVTNKVSPSLAFALAFEESRFKTTAYNKNINSIDRGLFQLNSISYPTLKERDLFEPSINARYGIIHLKEMLDLGGNEVAALAMYNAGNGRVIRDATPKKTLNYIFRILKIKNNLENLFEEVVKNSDVKNQIATLTENSSGKNTKSRPRVDNSMVNIPTDPFLAIVQ